MVILGNNASVETKKENFQPQTPDVCGHCHVIYDILPLFWNKKKYGMNANRVIRHYLLSFA